MSQDFPGSYLGSAVNLLGGLGQATLPLRRSLGARAYQRVVLTMRVENTLSACRANTETGKQREPAAVSLAEVFTASISVLPCGVATGGGVEPPGCVLLEGQNVPSSPFVPVQVWISKAV